MMNKNGWSNPAEEIKKRQKENRKLCPFMTNGDKKVYCNPDCKLFKARNAKFGYECPLAELNTISYVMRGCPGKQ